jgi:hypothetical protein
MSKEPIRASSAGNRSNDFPNAIERQDADSRLRIGRKEGRKERREEGRK